MPTLLQRRARRALERQLATQQRKAEAVRGREAELMVNMAEKSRLVRAKINAVQALPAKARVLEVGSGAHGLIFFFDAAERVGVDPLADEYKTLFPKWQGQAHTIAAGGEQLPFEDASFDVVLSDNVVDHAESPRRIVEEIARVLAPGGLLYFTVNVHHPFYHWAATAHAAWRALGIPFEITPFADHTVHLTLPAAKRLFEGLPFKFLQESDPISRTRRQSVQGRHAGDRLKRLFFKNARWELIARRD
ncbi:MAG TPA: class I SAM-dependent methyltransferase [Sphingomicrobium sp.]|nr:class I SAM-dependent methyltransferase [Sphingomicrobium sp.]